MRIRTVDGWTDDQAALAFFRDPNRPWNYQETRTVVDYHNVFMNLIAPLPPQGATEWDVALWNAEHPDRWTRVHHKQYAVRAEIRDDGKIAVRMSRGCGDATCFFDSIDTLAGQIESYTRYGESTHCEGMKEFYAEQIVAFREALKLARGLLTQSTRT